jgi:hypothetical protein
MANPDNYSIYYADKLWNLLPAIYRTLDTDQFNANGPLRELVNRIGAQAATLRRSIDRLWEDQSIESCDDWVISYIGALLATNLVSSLDTRGQRLDVAKTIYYRRRKGTVAILEEIAYDITGWDARVVEFFRRLGRTRHNFDPALVDPSADPADDLTLQQAQGLIGTWTNTYIGGWADLRNAYGASLAQSPFSISATPTLPSAFDEFFHTADFRAGVGRSGWYKIPNLGVFVWRLLNFSVTQGTPVQNGNCYTFDPTGRQVPLFAASAQAAATIRPLQGSWDTWVSPQEWQLPTPISTPLLSSALANPQTQPLYAALDTDGITLQPNSLGIFTMPGSFYELIDGSEITTYPEDSATTHEIMIFPEIGQFGVLQPPLDGPITVSYNYGFSAPMGAGPYDRRIIGQDPNPQPAPVVPVEGGAGAFSSAAVSAISSVGTVTLNDSLTYTSAPDFPGIQQLTVIAENQERPVIRFQSASPPGPPEWVFTGNDNSSLVLEGLFISGGDIVLSGSFTTVTLTCCTFDPGTSPSATEMLALPAPVFAQSIDGRDLAPTRIWIEGEVENLNIDRCILGPIRTRDEGEVETLTITNSIVQAIPTSNSPLLLPDDLKDPLGLVIRLSLHKDPISAFLWTQLSGTTQDLINSNAGAYPSSSLISSLISDLNAVISGPLIYNPATFENIALTQQTKQLINTNPTGENLLNLNRLLLEQAYPLALADLALAFDNGLADLSQCTVIGPAYVHRIEASECILDNVVIVENTQDGCVRFSATAQGSVIPRQYESVQILPNAPLFTSRAFGQPGYAQLLDSVDNAVLPGPATGAVTAPTISEGAEEGSEMGVFAGQNNPIKERSLLVKYQEYMPLGLTPLIIHAT